MHGGVSKNNLAEVNMDALSRGFENLEKHIENIKNFGLPAVVAINEFPTDTLEELSFVENRCHELGASAARSSVFAKGGEGGIKLSEEVEAAINKNSDFKFTYEDNMSIADKINAVATKIYGADGVDFTSAAQKQLAQIEQLGFNNMPICIAKTQYSLSDDANKLGRPKNFKVTVREIKISAGAGFIVVLLGNIMTMPGLPKRPAAENMDITNDGIITGLF